MKGYDKAPRLATRSPNFWRLKDSHKLVYFFFLTLAAYEKHTENYKGQQVIVQPGEFLGSRDYLKRRASALDYPLTDQVIRTATEKLEQLGLIATRTTSAGKLYRIIEENNQENNQVFSGKIEKNNQATKPYFTRVSSLKLEKNNQQNNQENNQQNNHNNNYIDNNRRTNNMAIRSDAEASRLINRFLS